MMVYFWNLNERKSVVFNKYSQNILKMIMQELVTLYLKISFWPSNLVLLSKAQLYTLILSQICHNVTKFVTLRNIFLITSPYCTTHTHTMLLKHCQPILTCKLKTTDGVNRYRRNFWVALLNEFSRYSFFEYQSLFF